MITRADIVAKAREYLGTPFHHQGRLKGKGIDCAGLIIGVAKDLKLNTFDHTAYGHLPHGGMMQVHCDAQMVRIQRDEYKIGDVLLMAFESEPQHLAFVTDLGMIHCYAKVRRCVEHTMDDVWRRRIRRAYKLSTEVIDG